MRWLSPPDRVAEARDRVRYSSPTFDQEAQALVDLLEHPFGDLGLLGGQLRQVSGRWPPSTPPASGPASLDTHRSSVHSKPAAQSLSW